MQCLSEAVTDQVLSLCHPQYVSFALRLVILHVRRL